MCKIKVEYEGTKFSLCICQERNGSVYYDFLVKQESKDNKWKWIYTPLYGDPVKIGNLTIPCTPVPFFNTENGIELSFEVKYENALYEIKATGKYEGKCPTDSFVSSCFENVLSLISSNPLEYLWGAPKTLEFTPKDNNNEPISLKIACK